MSGTRASGAAAIAGLSLIACAVLLALAAPARAGFDAPSFIRQWSASSGVNSEVSGIDVDRSGLVYMLRSDSSSSFRVFKYRSDGKLVPGQWTKPIQGFTSGGLTTDPLGHVFIAGVLGSGTIRLLEYTSDGGLLAAIPVKRLYGGSLDTDRAGHIYATGQNASGHASINEYSISGGKSKVIATGVFPGEPDTGFFPDNFLGIAVGPSGSVYGSGASSTSRFLARFAVGLGTPVSYLEQCSVAAGDCFGGFGVDVASGTILPGVAEPIVYAAGGYGTGADPANFYSTGIYRAFGDPSQYQGSFGPAPLPGSGSLSAFDASGSPCGGRHLYTLNSRFPGGTYDGVEVQEFDTHAPGSPCPPAPKAELSGLERRYELRVARHATSPCSPCAKLLPSGAFSNRVEGASTRASVAASRRARSGVVFKFRASSAADATFVFRRVAGKGAKTSLGGFVYPSRRGRNRIRFSGVLRKGHPLTPGTYRVTASAGGDRHHLKLKVLARR
jgi:hypothetical protein